MKKILAAVLAVVFVYANAAAFTQKDLQKKIDEGKNSMSKVVTKVIDTKTDADKLRKAFDGDVSNTLPAAFPNEIKAAAFDFSLKKVLQDYKYKAAKALSFYKFQEYSSTYSNRKGEGGCSYDIVVDWENVARLVKDAGPGRADSDSSDLVNASVFDKATIRLISPSAKDSKKVKCTYLGIFNAKSNGVRFIEGVPFAISAQVAVQAEIVASQKENYKKEKFNIYDFHVVSEKEGALEESH